MFLAICSYQEPGCQCVSSHEVSTDDPVIALAELKAAGHATDDKDALEFLEIVILKNGLTRPEVVKVFTASEV